MPQEEEFAFLTIEVAGTILAIKEDEAALVMYADCKHKGKTVAIQAIAWLTRVLSK